MKVATRRTVDSRAPLVFSCMLLVALGIAPSAADASALGSSPAQSETIPKVKTAEPLTMPEVQLGKPWQYPPRGPQPTKRFAASEPAVIFIGGIARLQWAFRDFVAGLPFTQVDRASAPFPAN